MARQSQTKNFTPEDLFDFDGAAARWNEATRKAGNDYLDLYEKTVDQLADLEVKTAGVTKLPFVTTIAETHAAVSREAAGAYVPAVRALTKARPGPTRQVLPTPRPTGGGRRLWA